MKSRTWGGSPSANRRVEQLERRAPPFRPGVDDGHEIVVKRHPVLLREQIPGLVWGEAEVIRSQRHHIALRGQPPQADLRPAAAAEDERQRMRSAFDDTLEDRLDIRVPLDVLQVIQDEHGRYGHRGPKLRDELPGHLVAGDSQGLRRGQASVGGITEGRRPS